MMNEKRAELNDLLVFTIYPQG